jgi:hypothetical protein
MFAPFAYALMLPQQLAVAIDRWHRDYGHAVDDWLRVVGELEALSSMATYAYEHPRDPFPTLVDQGPLFEAEPSRTRSFRRTSPSRTTCGLAAAIPTSSSSADRTCRGRARCCAASASTSCWRWRVRRCGPPRCAVAAGAWRDAEVEDSLEAGRSRFYAEILRIRTIVDAARGPGAALFLLDEILHGTNSYDRRIGAEAIVRALAEGGAIGLSRRTTSP